MSSIASPLTVPVASSRTAAYLQILSRALIAAIFLMSAIGKLTNFGPTVAFSGQMGLPAPQLAIAAAIIIEVAGGLALLLGYRVRLATLALIVFMIPTTLIFHASQIGNAVGGQEQVAHVLKNLAIIGGLLKFYLDAPPAREA
jgi:putative oxidoreductase